MSIFEKKLKKEGYIPIKTKNNFKGLEDTLYNRVVENLAEENQPTPKAFYNKIKAWIDLLPPEEKESIEKTDYIKGAHNRIYVSPRFAYKVEEYFYWHYELKLDKDYHYNISKNKKITSFKKRLEKLKEYGNNNNINELEQDYEERVCILHNLAIINDYFSFIIIDGREINYDDKYITEQLAHFDSILNIMSISSTSISSDIQALKKLYEDDLNILIFFSKQVELLSPILKNEIRYNYAYRRKRLEQFDKLVTLFNSDLIDTLENNYKDDLELLISLAKQDKQLVVDLLGKIKNKEIATVEKDRKIPDTQAKIDKGLKSFDREIKPSLELSGESDLVNHLRKDYKEALNILYYLNKEINFSTSIISEKEKVIKLGPFGEFINREILGN